jgi:16S rRNA (cytosine967-C5)-methyltransferase
VSQGRAVSPARRAAFEVLRRTFEHAAWADRAFPAAAERHGLEGRDRAQAQRLAYGAVQRRGTSDALAARLSGRDPERLDPPVVAALRLGLFELLHSDAPADHAAVDSAVELAKGGMRRGGGRRAAGAAGLVNAVLRRAARERTPLLASLTDDSPAAAAIAHSVPAWLAEMWWGELGADSARGLLAAINEPPETALRVNTLRADADELRTGLEEAGEPVRQGPPTAGVALPNALVWEGPLGPAALAGLRDGVLFAQSRAAQSVVAVLDPRPGERVLDLCAGPGVKTTAIAARMNGDGEVVAVERDPGRARQIEELAERAGARNVRVEVADAAAQPVGRGYDRVLVDPPCSDLGTLASRPDARWRKDLAAIGRLAAEQSAILARGLEAMAPDGALVYSTCTISARENRGVVEASGVPSERWSLLETRPDRDRTEGFFIARTGEGAAG